MGNMSYCRFRNTLSDFEDCLDVLFNYKQKQFDFSNEEKEALKQLLLASKKMSDNFRIEDFEE